jgi:hypothetical protein
MKLEITQDTKNGIEKKVLTNQKGRMLYVMPSEGKFLVVDPFMRYETTTHDSESLAIGWATEKLFSEE